MQQNKIEKLFSIEEVIEYFSGKRAMQKIAKAMYEKGYKGPYTVYYWNILDISCGSISVNYDVNHKIYYIMKDNKAIHQSKTSEGIISLLPYKRG